MKMKHLLTFLLFILFFQGYCHSPSDTTFFDKKWKACEKDSAAYYRVFEKDNNAYLVKDYYISGILQMSGKSLDQSDTLNRTGEFLFYSEAGTLSSRIHYLNNKLEGLSTHYYDNGSIRYTQTCSNNYLNGPANYYFPNSSLRRMEIYKNGKLKKGKCYTATGKDTAYYTATAFPEFAGGHKKLMEFMKKNTHYPEEEQKNKITGRVVVFFTVSKLGDIQDVYIKTPLNKNLDKEAIRVVESMPRWIPGRNYDVNVKVKCNVAITFKMP